MKPFVSVIVPCRDELGAIARCLDSALSSDYPADRMEVLVADGLSDDGSREVIEQYALRDGRVRRIDNPAQKTPAALNRAIQAARGDLILRLDAHSELAADYVRLAVEFLETSGADAVGGAMRTLPQSPGPFAEAVRIVLTHRFGVGNSHFRTGVAEPRWVDTAFGPCWRREVFERLGLFDENLERSQDLEFSLRMQQAGRRILLVPRMEIRYYARSELTAFCRHNWTNGVWAVLPFAYARGIPVRWRHMVPLGFVVGLVLTKGMALLPYAALSLSISVRLAWKERNSRLAVLLPLTFACLHLAYGAGSLWGLVRLAVTVLRRKIHDSHSGPIDSVFRLPPDLPLGGGGSGRDFS